MTMTRVKTATDSRFASYLNGIPERGQVVDMLVTVLREAILDGVLAPSSWLREAELSRELSVSRTPVREALRRLSVEGLVIISPHHGATVASLTIEDILQVYVVRETLEGLAARLAAVHRTSDDVERLRACLAEMQRATENGDTADLAKINIDFHRVIRQAAGNQYVDRFLTEIEHAVRRFGRTTYEIPGQPERSLAEHQKIVEALVTKDVELIGRLAVEHMRHARELRIKMLLGDE